MREILAGKDEGFFHVNHFRATLLFATQSSRTMRQSRAG